jgi:hypothetical protein
MPIMLLGARNAALPAQIQKGEPAHTPLGLERDPERDRTARRPSRRQHQSPAPDGRYAW